jgi:hypothetical protein
LLATAAAHAAALAKAPAPPPPAAPAVSAAAVGDDLHVTYDTHGAPASGLVLAVGDVNDPTPPAIHRVPVDTPSGTVTIPGAAAGASQTVHVSVAGSDTSGSPAEASGSPATAAEVRSG